MKIHRMTASFGTLQNDMLELGDGLNIVFAPNESGKSTWCSFIKSMLYGVDTSAREKGGVKPDKIRFAPWSGVPMGGMMDVEYEGTEITLARQGRENAPMRDFAAVYAGTATPVRGLDASAPGEALVGVTKDVFERSAFIGQGKVASGGSSPELERRIAAIVQTGEEGSSVSEAQNRIRAAMRRRRYNKTGRLPEIETELSEAKNQLAAHSKEAGRGEELQKAKREALERRDALADKLLGEQKKVRKETIERLNEIRRAVKSQEEAAENAADEVEELGKRMDAGPFGRENPQKCRQKLNADKKKLQALDKEESHGGSVTANICILIACMIVAGVTAAFSYYVAAAVFAALAVIQGGRLHLIRRDYERIEKEKSAVFEEYRCLTVEGMDSALASYEELFKQYGSLLVKQAEQEDSLAALMRARADLESSLVKEDNTAGGSQAATYRRMLADAEETLRAVSEETAAWEGRQSALRDPVELRAHIDALTAERKKLTFEYDALKLALDALSDSGNDISSRITPRLSARTAEIFTKLTAGKYDAVLLDKELKAAARQAGDSIARDASFLSTGAIDQLYLAVRLAICELALPEDEPCPIVLDDALVNFDDERCRCALEFLREMAQTRQIILFTCHGRELAFLRGAPDVRLTSVGRPG